MQCDRCGRELLNISWSKLARWEVCHARAKLYNQHRNPVQDIRNFFGGTVVDRVMRQWLMDSPEQNPGRMVEMVEEIARQEELAVRTEGEGYVKWRHLGDKKEMLDFCRELVQRLEPILFELVLPYEYQPAYNFSVPFSIPNNHTGQLTQVNLRGEIDILTRDEDEIFSLWDLKGTKDDSYWRKTWPQLIFYDIAIGASFGANCKQTGLIQPMCKERVLKFNITENDRNEVMTRIISMANDFWGNELTLAKDSNVCYQCPVKHACPRWKPAGDFVSRKLTLSHMATLAEEETFQSSSSE